MWRVFNRKEKGAIAGGFLLSVIMGVVSYLFAGGTQPGDPLFLFVESGMLLIASLIGIYAVYRVTTQMSGSIGRATGVIGAGYLLLIIVSIPHAAWHAQGTQPGYFGLGLTLGGLDIFFHVGSGLLFFFMAYGCYVAYKSQQGAPEVDA